MFGYIKPYKRILSKQNRTEYKRAYCALCHSLGNTYGFMARFILSYDMVFVLLCLDSLSEDKKELCFHCPGNRKRQVRIALSQKALEYISFTSYHLFCEKLSDNVKDSRIPFSKLFYSLLLRIYGRNKRYRKHKEKYMPLVLGLQVIMSKIDYIESGGFSNPDDALKLFGQYTACLSDTYCIENGVSEGQTELLRSFFGSIGKWIYLMDAADDYESDRRVGRFNLLMLFDLSINRKKHRQVSEETLNKVLYIHIFLIESITDISEKIDWAEHKDIIDNVLQTGMNVVFSGILEKKYRKLIQTKKAKGDIYNEPDRDTW